MSAKKIGSGAVNQDPSDKAELEDLRYAVEMLRIKLHSEMDLSKKVGYYNQIRDLQEKIAGLKSRIR